MNIEQLKKRADFAKVLRNILSVNIMGELVVAGGLVRDLWAAQVKGVDMKGSGDIDLLLIGNTCTDLNGLAEYLTRIPQLEEIARSVDVTTVDYSYEVKGDYIDADTRLYGVIQFQITLLDGDVVDVDILVYDEKFETLEEVLDTFNCNVNKFWFDEHGNGCSLFDGSQPFEYREGDREKSEERYEKCVMRYNLVAKAAHPYQRIDDTPLLV